MNRRFVGFISTLALASSTALGCASSDSTTALEVAPIDAITPDENIAEAQEPVTTEWCYEVFRDALKGCRDPLITPPPYFAICVIAVHAALRGCLRVAE